MIRKIAILKVANFGYFGQKMTELQPRGTPKWVARVPIFDMRNFFGLNYHYAKFGGNRFMGSDKS